MRNPIGSAFWGRLLLAARPIGLLAVGAMSAHAGTVTVTGAIGAKGTCFDRGGAGGAATATTTTPGDPSNTARAQGGRGGVGSNACSGLGFLGSAGGPGGAAAATATTKIITGSASAAAIGTGGAGGPGGMNRYGANPPSQPGGWGGGATAISTAADAGAGAVASSATAYGGNGGETYFGLPSGRGGTASAVALGQSTGSGSVTVSSSAFGGTGTYSDGSASASATGAALTGNVQANASATGGAGTTPATASAQSLAKNASGEALTTASSAGGGVGTQAEVGSVSLDPADVAAGRAVSNAVLTPPGPNVAIGDMAAGYGGSSSAVTYEATATFHFTTSKSEALDLKLLSDSLADTSAGIAFDSLDFQVIVDGTTRKTLTFSSLTGSSGAEKFFDADVVSLGSIAAGSQSIEIEYVLDYKSGTSAGVGDGFGFAYALVDPRPVRATVPEPSTWAMLLIGFGGLAFAGRRAHMARAFVK
jgi:PEP-CTERM motif-containing protein